MDIEKFVFILSLVSLNSNFHAPTKDLFTKTFRKHFSGPVVLELVCASEAPGNLIKTQIDPLAFLIQ